MKLGTLIAVLGSMLVGMVVGQLVTRTLAPAHPVLASPANPIDSDAAAPPAAPADQGSRAAQGESRVNLEGNDLTAEELTPDVLQQREGFHGVLGEEGRLHLREKDARFWPAVGVVLDVLQAVEARVSEAAAALGVSTGNLIDFLETEPRVWEQANNLRTRFGHKLLRGP